MISRISASAGSGKTYTLTLLFLKLLDKALPLPSASGCALSGAGGTYSLPEILAATFTNKAAAEMKSRVVSALKSQALEERAAARQKHGGPGQAERWVERILRHYGSLNIRTIDSLLVTLVRLSALELGIPPDFEPSFDAGEYYTPLYDSLMEDLAQDDDPRIFLTADGTALRKALADACRAILFLSNFTGFTPRDTLHNMLLALVERIMQGKDTPLPDSDAIHARLHVLHAAMGHACADLQHHLEQEELKANAHFLRYVAACARCDPYASMPGSIFAAKEEFDACLNKASRGKASAAAHNAFNAFNETSNAYAAALPLFKQALQLAPLVLLAHEIHARMLSAHNDGKLLPALRLPGLAAGLLCGEHGVSDALCRFGSRLSRLLLDEFQDTSREQWAALLPLAEECLSTGGSLTYVGDVKQAIYGWRGGDAALFEAVSADPGLTAIAGPAEKSSLPYNWRSHPAVVAHNNAFFSQLASSSFAAEVFAATLPANTPQDVIDEAGRQAAAVFSGVAQEVPPEKDWSNSPNASSTVRLYTVEGHNLETTASLVKKRLARLFAEELRPAWRYSDIALLVHSGKEGSAAASWLAEWGIPVVTENSFRLADHPLITRLVSFLSFLDYPLDDAAFWEFVSGPECLGSVAGLEAEALDAWLAKVSCSHGKKRPPLYQLFRKDFAGTWERWIAPFYSGAGLMSAYDTLGEAITHFRLAERMPGQEPFLRRFLEVAHLAESRGHSSLASFLAFWRGCEDSEKLPLPESMDAVRIMTIHKAKGLEFPVVILPFHHHGKRREPELVSVTHQGVALLTKALRELPDYYYPACVNDDLERLNLLYVAWTRPVHALHAFITRPARCGSPLSRALAVLLRHYEAGPGKDLCQWERLEPLADGGEDAGKSAVVPAVSGRTPEPDPADAPPLPRSPSGAGDGWRPMGWLPKLKIFRSPLPEREFTPRQRGILTHLCLEQLELPDGGAAHDSAPDIERAVRQGIRLYPLPLADPEAVALAMQNALAWYAALPDTRHWLRYGMREQGIMDSEGRMHRVDLLVDQALYLEHARQNPPPLLAIDYKTGLPPAAGGTPAHISQVQRYMSLAAQALSRPVQGLLVYLDACRIVPVDEESDAHTRHRQNGLAAAGQKGVLP